MFIARVNRHDTQRAHDGREIVVMDYLCSDHPAGNPSCGMCQAVNELRTLQVRLRNSINLNIAYEDGLQEITE